eukprot:c23412_g1_i1 orf=79-474(+)
MGMRAAMRQVMEGYSKGARARAMVVGGKLQARPFSSLFPSSSSSSEQQQQLQEGPPPRINPPDPENPDPATLREQWRYAISLYSKWYSHAWGTAILAGLSFFALGWFIKGGNPLLSSKPSDSPPSEEVPKG